MMEYQGDIESRGGSVALNSTLSSGDVSGKPTSHEHHGQTNNWPRWAAAMSSGVLYEVSCSMSRSCAHHKA